MRLSKSDQEQAHRRHEQLKHAREFASLRRPPAVSLPGLEYKEVSLAGFKMSDDDAGEMSGIASRFNNLDRQGDIVCAGAFAETLPDFLKKGFGAVNHEWSQLPIATISEAKETREGLWVRMKFHTTQAAQDVRRVIHERLERGKASGLSIGYQVIDHAFEKGARLLKKIQLFEVSLVSVPANPEAMVTAVKGYRPRDTGHEMRELLQLRVERKRQLQLAVMRRRTEKMEKLRTLQKGGMISV